MALSRVKSDVIVTLDAAKIEGALPAIVGTPLIGVSGGGDSVGRNNLALNYFEDLIRDSIDRLALTQGWIDTFEDTSDVVGGGVSVPMTRFDGVNDELNLASMSGIADGKEGTIAGWLNVNGTGVVQMILSNDSGFFQSRIQTTGKLLIEGSPNLSMTSIQNVGGIGLFHFMASWDLANTTGHLYINGIDDLEASPTFNNANIDYLRATTDWALGMAGPSDVDEFDGDMGQIYFDDSYIDLSIQANRELFVSGTGANAKPVDLGSNGEKPTGSRPKIYLNNPYGSFQTNLGTGGNFTVINGQLVDGGYITDKTYSSESFSNSYELIDSNGKENHNGSDFRGLGPINNYKVGQAITLSETTIVSKVGFFLKEEITATGNMYVEIQGVTGTVGSSAVGDDNIIAVSQAQDVSTIGTSPKVVIFTFPEPVTLVAGNYMFNVNAQSIGGSGSGGVLMRIARSTSTHAGNGAVLANNAWATPDSGNDDCIFYLYGQKNLDLITKGSDDIGNSPSTAPTKGHMEVLLSERPKSGTSIFSSNLDSDSTGDTGASYRQKVTPTGSGNRVRFKFDGATTKPSKYDNISIGKAVGSSYVTENIPVSILFGGQQSCIVPQSGSLWSDWLDMDIDASQLYLLTFDVTSDTSFNDSRRSTTSGEGYIGDWGANNYNLTTFPEIQGTTHESLGTFAISGMEVETKPTINTDIIAELSRDGGTTYSPVTLTRAKTNVGGSNRTIIGGEADFNGDPSGTNIVGRIRTANKDKIDIHGISVNW